MFREFIHWAQRGDRLARLRPTQPTGVLLLLVLSFVVVVALGPSGQPEGIDRPSTSGLALPRGRALGSLVLEGEGDAPSPFLSRPLQPDLKGRQAIEIRKSSALYDYAFPPLSGWEILDRETRQEIQGGHVAFQKWGSIVLHASGTAADDPRLMAAYHRAAFGDEGGVVYHFVIEQNPRGGGVRATGRWQRQEFAPGGGAAIHICLSGNFDTAHVGEFQLRALHELVTLLRAQVGEVRVQIHDDSRLRRGCLGLHFPRELVLDGLNPSHVSTGVRDELESNL